MIYVFDQDESTNVVCEGYSKAFQYLCDYAQNTESFDDNSIECYSVSGNMSGGTGAGPHMWNILHMEDGKNYIADITNSDGNSIGVASTDEDADGSYLFLNGCESSVSFNYISYVYVGKCSDDYYKAELVCRSPLFKEEVRHQILICC